MESEPLTNRVIAAPGQLSYLGNRLPLAASRPEPVVILVRRLAVGKQRAARRHPRILPISDQSHSLAHRLPPVGGENVMILCQRQVFSVCEQQVINGLRALRDNVSDVPNLEFTRLLVQDAEFHSA
ncbi:MAG TPA: hypothetical protein VGQ84_01935 [Gaiellaceae bacterium]|nr:hypothetical protein [Gaiellaceae bacterium]